jgi:hypothetical protein
MRHGPQASRVVSRLLSEDDETMPMAQALISHAKEAGWNVSVHHDTVSVGKGSVSAVVWYDEGRPVEVLTKVNGREQPLQSEYAADPQLFLQKLTSLGKTPT